jgi:3-oxoadipate CoA-transferase alpha subunit
MAGKITILQAKHVVNPGELDPEIIITPGIFVNRIIEVSTPAVESDLIAAGETYP